MPTEAKLFRIKPLEWEWFESARRRGYRARMSGFPDQCVYQEFRENSCSRCDVAPYWSTAWFVDHRGALTRTGCTTPEEGKQLAEAHWNEYIKRALIEIEQQ